MKNLIGSAKGQANLAKQALRRFAAGRSPFSGSRAIARLCAAKRKG